MDYLIIVEDSNGYKYNCIVNADNQIQALKKYNKHIYTIEFNYTIKIIPIEGKINT